jgi:MFS family permease
MPRRNPALLAIVAEGFLSRLSFGIVGFALPLYAFFSLGMSLTAFATLYSVSAVVALVLKPASGWVADRFGLKRTLTTAIAIRSLLCLGYALSSTPLQLYGVRAGHGLADSLRDPATSALIAEHGGKKALAQSFAWYQTAKTSAGSVGKAFAGFAITATASNYGLVFGIAFALSALPLLVVAFCVREPDRGASSQSEKADKPDKKKAEKAAKNTLGAAGTAAGVRPPKVARFAVLGFLMTGSASMLGNLFPILAVEYAGLTPAQASSLFLITPFLAFTGPVFGWLADHVDHRLVLSLRSVANSFSSLVYLYFPSFGGWLAGKSLDDLGKAAFSPAWGSVMAHVSSFDRTRRARIMGVLSAGEDAGDIVAPVVAGFVADTWGVGALLFTRLGVSVTSELYAMVVTGPLYWAAERLGVRPPRADLKVYVVGDQVFAVPDPLAPEQELPRAGGPGSSAAPPGLVAALDRDRGLGAGNYALNVVPSAFGPVVVGVEDFPGDDFRRSQSGTESW